MSVALTPSPVFSWFTPQGLPAVGYQLFTYIAGTTTPQATYVDYTQTTQNLNPVVLNSFGYASVWLIQGQTYKLVLEDTSGNTVWSVDQIPGGNALTQASLAQTLNPQTAAEVTANVTPTNYYYLPGNILRYGADPTGVASSQIAIQNAINVAQESNGGQSVLIPQGVFQLTTSLTITAAVDIQGIGVQPFGQDPTTGTTRLYGSWLYFNHALKGIICQKGTGDNTEITGIQFRNFGTYRNQPTVFNNSWAANANDFDIWGYNADMLLEDMTLLNPTKGIYTTTVPAGTNGGYAGRLEINRLHMQPFVVGVQIDTCYDVSRITNFHCWTWWIDNVYVEAYSSANLDVIYTNRCDGLMMSNIFGIVCRSVIRIGNNANGSTTKMQVTNLQCDTCLYGIYVDSSASGYSMQASNVYYGSSSSEPGSNAIYCLGSGGIVEINGLDSTYTNVDAVQIDGTNNNYTFAGYLRCVLFSQATIGIATVGTLTGTATSGTYPATALNGGSGTGAIATVTVAGGLVTAVTITTAGTGYQIGNTLSFTVTGGSGTCVVATTTAGTSSAVFSGSGNNVVIHEHPFIDSSGPRYAGTGNIWCLDWRTYTPSVTSGSGTITTLGAVSGQYRMHDETCDFQFDVAITTNGSAASSIQVSLPQAAAAGSTAYYGVGREINLTGNQLNISVPSASVIATVLTYNNAYPAGNGTRLVGNISYQMTGL